MTELATHRTRVQELREKIAECDIGVLRAVNKRARLHRDLLPLKAELGLPLDEQDQEILTMQRALQQNDGPLRDSQVVYLLEAVFDLTTEELT